MMYNVCTGFRGDAKANDSESEVSGLAGKTEPTADQKGK